MALNWNAREEPIYSALLAAALKAADPGRLLTQSLRYSPGKIVAGHHEMKLPKQGRLFLIAIGKAAPALASAAFDIFGDRIEAGLVTSLKGQPEQSIGPLRSFVGGHPLPNQASLAAGAYAAELLADAKPEDRVLALVSGGGSAMFELLPPGVDLDEWANLTDRLIRSGLPIEAINQVRQQISLVKNGRLARLAAPAQTIGFILSDVIGNPLSLVASGPTIPAAASSQPPQLLLQQAGLWSQMPAEIQAAIQSPSTQDKPIFHPVNILLGGNELVVAAAETTMTTLGYQIRVLSTTMKGEASTVGREFARAVLDLEPGQALIMGGETTVSVEGQGKGGPVQELALAAALELSGKAERSIFTLTTDGVDGNSPAAGAAVNSNTVAEIEAEGLDPFAYLQSNDSYSALASIAAALEIGPTGTNLNDLVVGWHPVMASE
jgi:hydroxypyruvate reductase